jgi:hypothetical protein
MDADRLIELNQRFGIAEARGAEGTAFFRDVLDASLCFGRGDGSVVGNFA